MVHSVCWTRALASLTMRGRDKGGGGLTGDVLYGPVQMVDVHGQPAGKILGGFDLQGVGGAFDGELPLQQFEKEGRDAGVGVFVFKEILRRLHFENAIHPPKLRK